MTAAEALRRLRKNIEECKARLRRSGVASLRMLDDLDEWERLALDGLAGEECGFRAYGERCPEPKGHEGPCNMTGRGRMTKPTEEGQS